MADYEDKVRSYLAQDYRNKALDNGNEDVEFLTDEEIEAMNPVSEDDLKYTLLRDEDTSIQDEYYHLRYEKEKAEAEYLEEQSVDEKDMNWSAKYDHHEDIKYARRNFDLADGALRKFVNSEEFKKSSEEYLEGDRNAGRTR